jgi:hypothetical protein
MSGFNIEMYFVYNFWNKPHQCYSSGNVRVCMSLTEFLKEQASSRCYAQIFRARELNKSCTQNL